MLTICDLFGADVIFDVLNFLSAHTDSEDFIVPLRLEQMIESGCKGYADKKGFFDYAVPENEITPDTLEIFEIIKLEFKYIIDQTTEWKKNGKVVQPSKRQMKFRLLRLIRRAIVRLENGEDIAVIDRELEITPNIGPLKLADLIGLDIVLNELSKNYAKTNQEDLKPPELLKGLVDDELYGRVSLYGFYDYRKAENEIAEQDLLNVDMIVEQIK